MAPRGAICTSSCQTQNRVLTGIYKRIYTVANILAYGLGIASPGTRFLVLRGEVEDYDCLLRGEDEEGVRLAGMQLKELPPEDLNPEVSLESLLSRLARGPRTDASLVIRLNRTGDIPDERLTAIKVPYAELWFLAALSPDGRRWRIFGDALEQPRDFEFDYPA